MINPFFSIIVVSYNAQDTITKTVNSVLKQNFDSYEIIVKDGLSTDDSLSRIPESKRIKVYSQKDTGIYDAMNQAIEFSNGKYICFLNCGDYFVDENVLKDIFKTAKKHDSAVVYGDYSRKGILFKQPTKLTDFYLYRTPLCHQTMFISRELFNRNGFYNIEYKILADYEHTLHDFFANIEFVHSDTVVCDYMGDGISESKKGSKIKSLERNRIIDTYFNKTTQRWYDFKLKLSLKKLRQKMISDDSPKWIRKSYRELVNRINGKN